MAKKQFGFRIWLVPLIVTAVVVLVPIGMFVYHELKATVMSRRLCVGDSFSVRVVNSNPYEDSFVFGGRIIATNGVYVQYVTDGGDTSSTNIRDCYLFPNTCKVVVTKKQ